MGAQDRALLDGVEEAGLTISGAVREGLAVVVQMHGRGGRSVLVRIPEQDLLFFDALLRRGFIHSLPMEVSKALEQRIEWWHGELSRRTASLTAARDLQLEGETKAVDGLSR